MRPNNKAFTLVEIIVTATIMLIGTVLIADAFLFMLRIMFKDSQRLETNAALRGTIARMTGECMDASQYYVFPTYQSISSTVNVATDTASATALTTTTYQGATSTTSSTPMFLGDCLVVVTLVSDLSLSSNIRQFRIFYRIVTAPEQDGELRMYKSADYGASTGTALPINTLLRSVNLSSNPRPTGSIKLAPLVHGRQIPSTAGVYPIFSSTTNIPSPSPQFVTVNMEIVGASHLSSSSLNYTIAPRK